MGESGVFLRRQTCKCRCGNDVQESLYRECQMNRVRSGQRRAEEVTPQFISFDGMQRETFKSCFYSWKIWKTNEEIKT